MAGGRGRDMAPWELLEIYLKKVKALLPLVEDKSTREWWDVEQATRFLGSAVVEVKAQEEAKDG